MSNQIIIPTLLLCGMFAFFGWVMKYQNAGDMINGFNEKIHDKAKVSKIMGSNLLFVGLSVIVVGIIGSFLNKEYVNYFTGIQTGIVIVGVIKAIYQTNKYGKIEK